MKVRDAMAKTISTARPTDTIQHVAQLMKKEDAGFIPVVDGDKPVGVITDRDIVLRCVAEGNGNVRDQKVEDCMTKSAATVEADADLQEAAKMMERQEIRRLVVVDNGKVAGVLSHGNLVQATDSEGAGDLATLGVTKGA
jgi:CBS domain-containing protein